MGGGGGMGSWVPPPPPPQPTDPALNDTPLVFDRSRTEPYVRDGGNGRDISESGGSF